MADDEDTGAEGRGKVDETTRAPRYEGMQADPNRVWLPYAEMLAYVQQVGGTSFTVEAARSWLLRVYKNNLVTARFPKKLIRRYHSENDGLRHDHPTSWPPLKDEDWREEWEEDKFSCWLPSIEAALGSEPEDRRQPTGAPWTAENTEWERSELEAALFDPETEPVMRGKVTDKQNSTHTDERRVEQLAPSIKTKNSVLVDELLAELRRMHRAGELTGISWNSTAKKLSVWCHITHPGKPGSKSAIYNHAVLEAEYKCLLGKVS